MNEDNEHGEIIDPTRKHDIRGQLVGESPRDARVQILCLIECLVIK